MIGLGKGSSSVDGISGLDPLMNSPLMQTLRGNNQAPEMAGNTANLDLLALLKGNRDYWQSQGQKRQSGGGLPDLDFNLPQAPQITPRAPSGNRQAQPLVDVDELIRRRLYGGR